MKTLAACTHGSVGRIVIINWCFASRQMQHSPLGRRKVVLKKRKQKPAGHLSDLSPIHISLAKQASSGNAHRSSKRLSQTISRSLQSQSSPTVEYGLEKEQWQGWSGPTGKQPLKQTTKYKITKKGRVRLTS